MEFLLLFVLNIFTGALIYLLLSLKIERSSSTYQEQKLKKEMGEIITEFNATAERNITLLENKIALLRRLMGEAGALKSMDVTLHHKPENENAGQDNTPGMLRNNAEEKKAHRKSSAESDPGLITKKVPASGETGFLGGIMDKMHSIARTPDLKAGANNGREAGITNEIMDFKDAGNIAKKTGNRIDFRSDDAIDLFSEDDMEVKGEDNPDIAALFRDSVDKYALIAELSTKGYSIDELAEYSGLPAGEIKLVISLNN